MPSLLAIQPERLGAEAVDDRPDGQGDDQHNSGQDDQVHQDGAEAQAVHAQVDDGLYDVVSGEDLADPGRYLREHVD